MALSYSEDESLEGSNAALQLFIVARFIQKGKEMQFWKDEYAHQ